ncbi:MAG: hypothetical protein ABJD07_05690 [Gemmatimonadaceae bacterium]
MRRCAAVLLVTSVVACADPTSSVATRASLDMGPPPPVANAAPATLQAEVVTVVLHNDALGWSVTSIDALPKHQTPYWFAEFGIPGRGGVQTNQLHAALAPNSAMTTTFAARAGALRGRQAWLHAAAAFTGKLPAGEKAPATRAIKCGPKAPSATTVAHQFSIEFHLAVEKRGAQSFLRCR